MKDDQWRADWKGKERKKNSKEGGGEKFPLFSKEQRD